MESLFDRREFFSWVKNGLGSAAFASLLLRDGTLQAADSQPKELPARLPYLAARAKRAIHICLFGAMSQVDTFDYKPELIRLHGKPLPSSERPDVFFGKVGLLRKPDWEFRQRGQSG